MRMLCDTPYILDRNCRISPKLKELGNLLEELTEDGDHKVIIFSEWERMLELVRERAEDMGFGYAWHTGKVPQPRRRSEIRRFKDDPDCRLFLSTDSGATGLNLQAADVVINLDMPWTPARLEQRIARAWRKHQKRSVQVINLVSEHTIEHRMLALLEQKRSLAEGVLDGKGGREMALPSGRAAFLERIESLMTGQRSERQAPAVDPFDQLRDEVVGEWSDHLDLVELHGEAAQRRRFFSVEALVPMHEAVEAALKALCLWRGHNTGTPPALGLIDSVLVQTNLLPAETLSLVARLREEQAEADEAQATRLLAQSDKLVFQAASMLGSAQGR